MLSAVLTSARIQYTGKRKPRSLLADSVAEPNQTDGYALDDENLVLHGSSKAVLSNSKVQSTHGSVSLIQRSLMPLLMEAQSCLDDLKDPIHLKA